MKPKFLIHTLLALSILSGIIALPLTGQAAPNNGTVSGTVTYTGSDTGTHNIVLGLHPDINGAPAYATSVYSPGGAYTFPVAADGTYYVSAYLDLNDSGGPPQDNEPFVWYDPDYDGNPDSIVISGSDVSGIDITFGDAYHVPQVTLAEKQWKYLGGDVSDIAVSQVDLDFYTDAEHNAPAMVFSNNYQSTPMMKWNGNSQAWEQVGSTNAVPAGAFRVPLDINDSDAPYIGFVNENNAYKANVRTLFNSNWIPVGGADFSPGPAGHIDMQLKSDGTTPVVAFYDYGAPPSGEGSVMTLGTGGWEYVGRAGFTPYTVDDMRLVLDSSGTPWVLWRNSANIGVMKHTGAGTSEWESVGGVTTISGQASDASMAIDDADTVYIAFRDGAHSGRATVMKHSGALTSTWETVGSAGFSDCGSGIYYPDLAIDNNGVPYIVFTSYCDSGSLVVMKYTGSGTTGWKTVGPKGFTGGSATYPVIKFDNQNTPFVGFANSSHHPAVMYPIYEPITQTTVTMSEDGSPDPFTLALRGTDGDGEALTWSVGSQPSHGSAAIATTVGATGTVTSTIAYTPTVNYNGSDSFVVQLIDSVYTVSLTVDVTISPENDPPTAFFADRTVTMNEAVTLDGSLSSDVDGDAIAAYHWAQTGGTAVSFTDDISQTTFTAPGMADMLTFSLTVTDTTGLQDSHAGTVWVVDGDASAVVLTDTETVFSPPAAPFTITVPAGGVDDILSLVYTDTGNTQTPPTDFDFVGNTFSLEAFIGGVRQTGFIFNEPFTITLHYSDDDLNGLSESSIGLHYWNGSAWSTDGITRVSLDTSVNLAVFTVSHLSDFAFIAEINTPPMAVNDVYTATESTPLDVAAPGVLANDSDADGDSLAAVLDTDVTTGTLTLNANGSFVYTPTLNYNGVVTFTYHASDGSADSNIATVTITVEASTYQLYLPAVLRDFP